MPFKCPETSLVPKLDSEVFSLDFNVKMSGNQTTNIDYSTKSITFSTPTIKYDILKIKLGVNDPMSKHTPRIVTWITKKVTKKIKLFGKNYPISINVPTPTQVIDEIYLEKSHIKIIFFTIEPFNFKMNSNLSFTGSTSNNFQLSVDGPGGTLLALDTANLIDSFLNDGKKTLTMNTSDQTKRIENMLANPNFLAVAMSTTLITYLLRDSLSVAYTILKASGKINFTLNNLTFGYGDKLKIDFPKFNIAIDLPDILKDPITGQEHPVTVSGYLESGLILQVQLLVIQNLDFFGLILTGLQNTLDIAKKATGTEYNPDYVKELGDILTQLQNADDSVTNWLKKYLGMTLTITIYFVFCPAGMSNVPPTPFYLQVNLEININPYKILEDLLDLDLVIEESMSEFENYLLNEVESITKKGSSAHALEKIMQSALNLVNKELKKVTLEAKKKIDNKYLNKIYTFSAAVMIPIEPPP